jgi:RNA polymerase sigma-70 factor (ECF subfamily)
MPSDEIPFDVVLDQLRQRDAEAARAVCERFRQRLNQVARQRLDPRLQAKLDPEDIVQSVFRTVFKRLADGQFALEDWDNLYGLLYRVTARKCGKWYDYFHAQGRDVDQEVALAAESKESAGAQEIASQGETPSEAAILAETVEQVLRGMGQREQQVVLLSLQGLRVAEVSRELHCTETKVYRVLKEIRRRLESLRDQA